MIFSNIVPPLEQVPVINLLPLVRDLKEEETEDLPLCVNPEPEGTYEVPPSPPRVQGKARKNALLVKFHWKVCSLWSILLINCIFLIFSVRERSVPDQPPLQRTPLTSLWQLGRKFLWAVLLRALLSTLELTDSRVVRAPCLCWTWLCRAPGLSWTWVPVITWTQVIPWGSWEP